MLLINEIKLELNENEDRLKELIEKKLKHKINSFEIKKKSLDARKKPHYVYSVLVDIDDEHNAAGAVLRILNDETLRSKLIENGTRVVEEKFSIERVAKEHEALFEEIL